MSDATIFIPEREINGMIREFGPDYDADGIQLFFAVRSLAQRINDATSRWLSPFGLSATKYSYLAVLYANRATGLSPSDIGIAVHTVSGTVSSMIAALERDGLIERISDEADRRRATIRLTKKGERVFHRAALVHHANIRDSLAELQPAEVRSLLGLLSRLGDGLTAYKTAI